MCALRILDPEGVSLRSQHCLSRRQYYKQGPNFLVHIDGYDKLDFAFMEQFVGE